ncbi:MAG TPA: hypothetical protein VMT24_12035 [Aggregatilineaceae bacterium]|nr:hypothetical protein [Aggregatilineaceae bacterium]
MRQWTRWVVWLGLAILVGGGGLAACQRNRGSPIQISRDFIVATWTGNTKRVQALSCKDTRWSITGDPTLTVEMDHAHFEVTSQTKTQVDVALSGIVTFKSPGGQIEVRDLDQAGTTVFVLEDEHGWKVCDVR